jgi:putative ABC transport system permease protein
VLAGVLEALLYDIDVTDPPTFVVMVGVLALVSIVASWLPATRAGGVDPVRILRQE